MGLSAGLTKIIPVLFLLYMVALCTSMSGMEILSWSIVFFLLITMIFDVINGTKVVQIHTIGIEVPLFFFVLVVYFGLKINAPDTDFAFNFGNIRNWALVYFLCYALQINARLNRLFYTLMTVATLVSIYGIYQHFTGFDAKVVFLHKEPVLAPAPGFPNADHFSVIGFFGHHLTFAHTFAMIVTIPWAALLLGNRLGFFHKLILGLVWGTILTAIILTFGRGAWIALAITFPLMALFVSRKAFFGVVLAILIAGFAVWKGSPAIGYRMGTITDSKYFSNADRKDLWAINMEMFYDHPWIGVGYRVNEDLCASYKKKLQIENDFCGHAHSNYIQMLSTTGILGTACYMLIMIGFILLTMRLYSSIPSTHYWHRVFMLAGIGSQLAFHIGGLTQWNFGTAPNNHVLMFWFAVIAYVNEKYHRGIVPDDRAI